VTHTYDALERRRRASRTAGSATEAQRSPFFREGVDYPAISTAPSALRGGRNSCQLVRHAEAELAVARPSRRSASMFVFVGHDPHQRPWVYHLPSVGTFGAVKWRRLRRILEGEPLGYRVTRPTGSHRTMEARGRPTLHLSFHDSGVARRARPQDPSRGRRTHRGRGSQATERQPGEREHT
jgi:hypothetical protein